MNFGMEGALPQASKFRSGTIEEVAIKYIIVCHAPAQVVLGGMTHWCAS